MFRTPIMTPPAKTPTSRSAVGIETPTSLTIIGSRPIGESPVTPMANAPNARASRGA
ncbi:MAG: hypothetical protein ABI277_15610 [Burkholderiaceae bacterium]